MNLDGTGEKPRLTAEQKKANHIESEKKRREAIRGGFEKLAKIVPDCEGQARSEAVVLQKTVGHLKAQLKHKGELKKKALSNGMSEAEFEAIYRDAEAAAEAAESPRSGKSFDDGGAGSSKTGGGR